PFTLESDSPCLIKVNLFPFPFIFSFNSETEPKTCIFLVFSPRHTGNGAPQKRDLETAQSRAFSSHLPKRPSPTSLGTQLTFLFSSTRRSLKSVTFTNQEEVA